MCVGVCSTPKSQLLIDYSWKTQMYVRCVMKNNNFAYNRLTRSLPTCAVLGQIRTTVCQAQLLMRQKLKQFIGLVGQAEHGGGEQPTKVEDLQGFWDMVYFQVEDILKKFQGLEDLEKNNWKMEQALEPAAKKRKVSLQTQWHMFTPGVQCIEVCCATSCCHGNQFEFEREAACCQGEA